MLPLARRAEIIRRHEAVDLLVRLESASEMPGIKRQLGEVGALPKICYYLNKGVGSVGTWASLLRVCTAPHTTETPLNTHLRG